MPFDVRDFPGVPPEDKAANRRNRQVVAAWLFTICGMILVMIVLGGATRLTGSGLSIMEWAPFRAYCPRAATRNGSGCSSFTRKSRNIGCFMPASDSTIFVGSSGLSGFTGFGEGS